MKPNHPAGNIMVSAQAVFGQDFHYSFYTEKDGLSKRPSPAFSPISRVLMGTTPFASTGFDGNEFEQFYNDPADSGSIADNNIQKLFLDAENRLWIGTNAGLSLYHPGTNSFSNYFRTPPYYPSMVSASAPCARFQRDIWSAKE